MAESSVKYRSILAMVGACACFSANDAACKIAAQYLPVSEIVAVRALFTLLFALIIIVLRNELAALPRIRDPYILVRGLLETIVGVLLVHALSLMPLADLTAILLVQPFLLTLAGAVYLQETVGWQRWLAVIAGFVGMLLVIKPGTSAFDLTSLFALAAAFCVLFRDLLVRKIPTEVPTTVISFATAVVAVPVGFLGALAQEWTMASLFPLAMCVVAAAFLVIAFTLMVLAFRGAAVSVVSPFRYSLVVFAVIFGFIIFGEIPDTVSFIGIGIIFAAGLYSLHRETKPMT